VGGKEVEWPCPRLAGETPNFAVVGSIPTPFAKTKIMTNPGKELAKLRKKYWEKNPEKHEAFRNRQKKSVREALVSGRRKRGANGRFQKVK
jgi:hypothetical protein